MKSTLVFILIVSVVLVVIAAASIGDDSEYQQILDRAKRSCDSSSCTRTCQKIGHLGGNCIFGFCKCFDL